MITEILSMVLLAMSLNSTPNRAVGDSGYYILGDLSVNPARQSVTGYFTDSEQTSETINLNDSSMYFNDGIEVYTETDDDMFKVELYLDKDILQVGYVDTWTGWTSVQSVSYGWKFVFEEYLQSDFPFNLTFELNNVPTYTFTGAYNNCDKADVDGYTPFPSTPYRTLSNPYGAKFTALPGYHFPYTDYGEGYLPVLTTTALQAGGFSTWAIRSPEFYPNSRELKSFVFYGDFTEGANQILMVQAIARSEYSLTLDLVNSSAVGTPPSTFVEGQSVSVVIATQSPYAIQSNPSSVTISGVDSYDVVYSERVYGTLFNKVTITFTAPKGAVDVRVVGVPYTADYESGYNQGEADGMSGSNLFGWVKTLFDGMAGVFNIQIIPGITLGILAFSPLIVVAIVAIVRIIRHD